MDKAFPIEAKEPPKTKTLILGPTWSSRNPKFLTLPKLEHLVSSLAKSDFKESLSKIMLLDVSDKNLEEAAKILAKAKFKVEVLA